MSQSQIGLLTYGLNDFTSWPLSINRLSGLYFSRWSGDGCRRVGGDDQHTKCECDHMTNFAVLLDVTGANEKITAEHDMALRIITYAGCITSIICLLLAWMTFQFLK